MNNLEKKVIQRFNQILKFERFRLLGSFLAPITSMQEYKLLRKSVLKSKAMNEYCSHGNRFMMWLPYQGMEKNIINVTHIGSNEILSMHDAWIKRMKTGGPITSARPWCAIARFGECIFLLISLV